MIYDNMTNNHLLVKCETSNEKELKESLVNSFKKFEDKFGIDCSKITREIERHGLYMTNGQLYFLYNSRLSFMQKFRSKREDVLKLLAFYNTFDMKRTSFWTITRKNFRLSRPIFVQSRNKTRIEFEEINQAERNLRSLFYRLETYGYHITKYILVPEIKEEGGFFNYHYHGIFETEVDIKRIRSNPKVRYRDLVYNKEFGDLSNGWINFPVLSSIWKEITKNDSYRIKREEIRKKLGVFNYVLSYINKGIEYENIDSVPYLYFAMKSKKAYRIKGLKKMPKIKYQVLDKNRNRILFHPLNISWIEKDKIPIDFQEYFIILFKDGILIEEKAIREEFKKNLDRKVNGNRILAYYDESLYRNRNTRIKRFQYI